MAEELLVSGNNKVEHYQNLIPQLKGLIDGEPNLYANLSNISAALKQVFNFFWVGFYLVDSEDELVLGPFQGDIACTRIKKGKGVCGTCWSNGESIIVSNVEDFPGHIACSALSKSEIVVPVIKDGVVRLILDVDSDKLNDFDENDRIYLEQVADLISSIL
ncbi:MAG: GAF domain-containing protein [Putridiphycobacter sp.]